MVQLVFCISDWVMWSEVGLEFQDELLEVVHPGGVECQIFHLEEVWFKPFQGHAFEVRLCKGNFGAVLDESLGVILEIQLALDQEGPKFAGFCSVELIWFVDLGARSQFRGGATSGTSKAADHACEVRKHVMRDLLIIILILVVVLVIIERVIIIQVVIRIVVRILTIQRFISGWALFIWKTLVVWRSAEGGFSISRTIRMMGGFGGVIIVRRKFDETSDRGWRVGLLRRLGSRPWSTTGGETTEYFSGFWTSSIALESAEGFESGGQVVAGGCHASLRSGGTSGHSVVVDRDF